MNEPQTKPKRVRAKKKIHQIRVKSKSEFIKFEKNLSHLLQRIKEQCPVRGLVFKTELFKDPNAPKIRLTYSLQELSSQTDVTVEPGSFEFEFEDGLNRVRELTAYMAGKLIQEQVLSQVLVWDKALKRLRAKKRASSALKGKPKRSKPQKTAPPVKLNESMHPPLEHKAETAPCKTTPSSTQTHKTG